MTREATSLRESLWGLELLLTGSYFAVGACCIHVVNETAVSVRTILLDDELARKECQCDLASLRVRRRKGADIPINGSFAHRVSHVWTPGDCHVDAVELNLQFVVTESQDAELAFIIAIDAVRLGGSDDF